MAPQIGLTTFTLDLVSDGTVRFRSYSGFACRGAFFNMLKRVDANVATKLHEAKALAPYALTPLEVSDDRRTRIVYRGSFRPGIASLRIASLNAMLSRLIVEALAQRGLTGIQLVDRILPLSTVRIHTISSKELVRSSKPVRQLAIRFRSPCFFRRLGVGTHSQFPSLHQSAPLSPFRYYPLPDPVLLFRSIARLWRAFSGHDLDLKD